MDIIDRNLATPHDVVLHHRHVVSTPRPCHRRPAAAHVISTSWLVSSARRTWSAALSWNSSSTSHFENSGRENHPNEPIVEIWILHIRAPHCSSCYQLDGSRQQAHRGCSSSASSSSTRTSRRHPSAACDRTQCPEATRGSTWLSGPDFSQARGLSAIQTLA